MYVFICSIYILLHIISAKHVNNHVCMHEFKMQHLTLTVSLCLFFLYVFFLLIQKQPPAVQRKTKYLLIHTRIRKAHIYNWRSSILAALAEMFVYAVIINILQLSWCGVVNIFLSFCLMCVCIWFAWHYTLNLFVIVFALLCIHTGILL